MQIENIEDIVSIEEPVPLNDIIMESVTEQNRDLIATKRIEAFI